MVNYNSLKKAAIITILFTVGDYILHAIGFTYFPHNSLLGNYYYIGKLIGSTAILYYLLEYRENWHVYIKSLIVGLILQGRYYFTYPYSMTTNIVMILVHAMLVFISFKLLEKY